jgi:hypothetical protein
MEIGKMIYNNETRNGQLIIAYAETIGTIWDSEEETHMKNIDQKAVNRFIYEDLILGDD